MKHKKTRSLLENEGTATSILQYLRNIEKIMLQAVNKRVYNVILPITISSVLSLPRRLSEPYVSIKGVQNWKYPENCRLNNSLLAMWDKSNGTEFIPEF